MYHFMSQPSHLCIILWYINVSHCVT